MEIIIQSLNSENGCDYFDDFNDSSSIETDASTSEASSADSLNS